MKIVTDVARMRALTRRIRRAGKSIGFVPTMGALHEGHLSLVRAARRETDTVVMSIFVNPAQFGPREDFARYPRDPRGDRKLAAAAGVDILFSPRAAGMYPAGYATSVTVDGLSERLCGASRPGHFTGVATVVAKLFNIVHPTAAYFGRKDAQQAAIIGRMTEDLSMDVAVRVLPIVREPDGLAMSSRNRYLTAEERGKAVLLSRALAEADALIISGERDPRAVARAMRRILRAGRGIRIDYIVFVHPGTLAPKKRLSGTVLIALAATIGKTRLIDNRIRKVPA